MDKCPKCGAIEIEADTPRTVYSCGSSDYDNRPGTFKRGDNCNMDIEFIKWMVEKAAYYQMSKDGFILSVDDQISLCEWSELKDEYKPNYRDILQSAIEGVTRSHSETSTRYWIEMSYNAIEVYDSADGTVTANYYFDEFQGDIDQAKESALKYIYEQEKK